jgi:hypothetical protein
MRVSSLYLVWRVIKRRVIEPRVVNLPDSIDNFYFFLATTLCSFLPLPAIFVGVMKRAIARCLGVMVAMGWGVIRDSLGSALAKIIFFGLLYCGVTAVRDVFTMVAVAEVKHVSTNHEDELIDIVLILSVAIIAINFTFYCWIMNSMSATTAYLQNMNQTSKLRRHLRLRCIIWVSLAYSVAWLVMNVIGFPNLALEWAW